MRIAFAGSPEFAATILARLLDTPFSPMCVYTQPDRKAGRGRQLQPNPVKVLATEAQIPVHQPTTLRDSQAQAEFAALDLDLFLVVAYGLILPREILESPRLGCLNVHASLLPRWRGAAPIERAFIAGDQQSGVSIMRMDEGLDTGPVYIERSVNIDQTASINTLQDQLCALGADALIEVLGALEKNPELAPTAQSEEGACYAPKLTAADRTLDWQQDAEQLARQVNALASRMPVRCQLHGRGLQLIAATAAAANTSSPGAPIGAGEITAHLDSAFEVTCAMGKLQISKVKLEGKGTMDVAAALRGYPDVFRIGNQLT